MKWKCGLLIEFYYLSQICLGLMTVKVFQHFMREYDNSISVENYWYPLAHNSFLDKYIYIDSYDLLFSFVSIYYLIVQIKLIFMFIYLKYNHL